MAISLGGTGVSPVDYRRPCRNPFETIVTTSVHDEGEATPQNGIGRDAQFNSRDGCSTLSALRALGKSSREKWGGI
jgi:hypothetical protein